MAYLTKQEFCDGMIDKKFYKLLNKLSDDEYISHNKFVYILNEINFDDNGLYFTKICDLAKYSHFGKYILEVEFPNDAIIHMDVKKNRYKSDKLIIKNPIKIDNFQIIDTDQNLMNLIKYDPQLLRWIDKQTNDLSLEAVQIDGMVLQYVKNKSLIVNMYAIRQNGKAIQFIDQQNIIDSMIIQAIKQNPYALEYIHKQNFKICKLAVSIDGMTLRHVKNNIRTTELCDLAIKQNYMASIYV